MPSPPETQSPKRSPPVRKPAAKPLPMGLPIVTLPSSFPQRFNSRKKWGGFRKGGKVSRLHTLIDLIGGGTPKTSVDEYWNGSIPWFSVVDAPNNSDVFVIDTDKKITELGLEQSSTKILREGSTIISARGTVGKCALVGKEMAMNQSCYGIHGANGIADIYTYYTIRQFVSDLQHRGHGSVFNTITRDTFQSIYVPFGKVELTRKFDQDVNPLLKRIRFNLCHNTELTNLRDTLLPKLISGEIRIPRSRKTYRESLGMKSTKAQFSPRPDTPFGSKGFSVLIIIFGHVLGRGRFHICPVRGRIWNPPLQFWPNDDQGQTLPPVLSVRCNSSPAWGLNKIYDSAFSRLSR